MKKRIILVLLLTVLCIASLSACSLLDIPLIVGGGEDVDDKENSADTDCQHTFGEWTENKPATCKEEGERVRVCDKCSATESAVIEKSDVHTEVKDAPIPASCTREGRTEGSHCSVCKKVLTERTAVEKTEHKFTDNLCVCGLYKDSEGLAYSVSGNRCAVIGSGTCEDARIVVPATYGGVPVTAIAEDAFADTDSFYEIVLPTSLTEIGARAFENCKSLKAITIPDGVEYLERETFSGCSALKTVKLPSGLIQIMESCFASCISLEKIDLPKALLKIREFAFYNCSSLETVILPSSLNEIQQCAFLDCTSLTFEFRGMKWQFKQISKGVDWSGNTASCLVKCYDGEFDIFYD